MIQFNPDGSIKLPDALSRQEEDKKKRMIGQKCMLIRKEVVSDKSPKSCQLKIKLSDAIIDSRFIETIHSSFRENASVPTRIEKIGDKEFLIIVGTHFRRCSDCSSLIGRYREFLDGNLIEEKGTCSFEGRMREFSYEDYFD